MKKHLIEKLRESQRKLVRELGMLQLTQTKKQETPVYWHALVEISKEPGLPISKLGKKLLLTLSTVSRLVKGLVKEGKVEFTDAVDKREKGLKLTLKGEEEVRKIDSFSEEKLRGAIEYLGENEIINIIETLSRYGDALERNREKREQVKILTLSSSRPIRKQIVQMIEEIQKGEFDIPVTDEINASILKAEEHFYYNQSYNFWYAVDDKGKIIGSIGLKQVGPAIGEVKKMFVRKEYRSVGVSQKLLETLIKAAQKHGFKTLVLGTVEKLTRAHRFYEKYGFKQIQKSNLPQKYDLCPLDTVFYKADVSDISAAITSS